MVKRVDIPGVGSVDFPDEMDEAAIGKAIETDILPNARNPAQQEPSLGPVGQFTKKAIGAATEAVGAALGAKYGKTHAGYGEEPAAGPLEQPASQAELAAANANPANAAANAVVLDTNPQRLVADTKAKADAQRYMRGDGAGDMTAAPERGPLQRALDATVRKPMDGSLAGLAVETAGDAARGASRGVYGIVGSGYSALQAGAEALGQGGDVSGFAGEAGKVARQDAGQMSNPSDPNSITQQVFESATTNLAPIGAFGAGNKALVAMGAQAAAGDYGQSRDNGLSHEDATGRAAFMGAAEVIGEKVGMPALGKLLAGAAGRVGYKELGHLIADHAFKEQVGEQATTLLQDAYEKWGAQGRQPGMTLENYLEDVANTAKVTLGQSLLMAGGAATIRKASDAMPGANDRMLGQALADDIQQAPPLAQWQLDRAATGLLAPGATPVDSQPRSGVMLAGRAVESFTDQQLQRYAKSGVLTSAVQSKVDAELARRGAAAPAQQPATPASTGEQLDSAVQRYADGAGIGQPAEPGAGQQPADAGRGAGDASAPDGQPEGGVRADAGSPAGSVREGAPDALGGAQRQVALGDGSVIPAPIGDPLAHNVQQRQEAINDVTSQQKERDAYVPEPNAANNFQRANDTLRAAGVRGGPTFAGDGPDVATREVHDFNVGGVGNSAGLAVGQQHLADYIKQQADRGVTVEPESLPNLSPIRDARLAREAQAVADVLHAVTGVQHYMFDDQRQGAADGLTYRGRSYVNAGNLEQSLPFTAWHETFHAAEQRAARGDASAKKFVQVFNSIFDDHINEAARAQYISTHPEFQGKSLSEVMAEPELARKLKSEMMADFLGKRGDDMKWLRHVAQKNPAGFGGFIRTWIDRLTNLIDEFKAKRNLGNRDVDQYIRKLSHAKAVAASAFIEWRNANKAEAEKLPQAGGTNTLSRSLKLEPHQVLSPETLTAASQLGWKMNKPLSTLTPEMRAKAEGMLVAPARLAAEAKADFDRKVTNIAEQLGGDAQLAPVKGMQRAAEKLAIDYRYEVSRIGDMLRASIVVPTLQEVPQAIRAVGQNFDVVGIKDRFTDPTESGYRDMLVNVRLPNGLRAEIQVHIPEMLAAKKIGHKAYEVQREIESANPSDPRLGELYALQSRIYGEAFDKAQARLRDSSSASMERNTDSLTGVAAEKVSDALNGRLSGSNAKQEPSGSLATGTSSQSKNLVPAGNSGESIAHSKKVSPIVGEDGGSRKTVSTRVPTAKKSTEDAIRDDLSVDLEALNKAPDLVEKLAARVKPYPQVRTQSKTPAGTVKALVDISRENLLWLHDQVPEDIRQRSKLWYDGANKIAARWAQRYGISLEQASAMVAVLSPQKDWFMNVSLAERVADILAQRQDFQWDKKMESTAARIFAKEEYADKLASISGKKLSQLHSNYQRAMWVRTYDEAHNSRNYQVVDPDGSYVGWMTTKSGNKGRVAWGSLKEIGKAISVYHDGSRENISAQLGGMHKVRNFYNNIVDPNSLGGYSTIDTHAVAAALMAPMSGSSIPVAHNFGAAGKSAITGVRGTYPIYAEAYRQAAEARGILPREMQSITWEAVRGLFPAEWKTAANGKAVADIWQEYKNGKITSEQARNRVATLSGGINNPSWHGRSAGRDEGGRTTSYEGALPHPELPGRGAEPTASGTGSGTSGGVQEQLSNSPKQVVFEVAPDPNNTELSGRWNALPAEGRLNISERVMGAIVPKVLDEFGATGETTAQVGSYLDDTNPSFALLLDSGADALGIANALGHVLAQDSMVVVSHKAFAGGDPTGAIAVRIGNKSEADVRDIYNRLRDIRVNGEQPVGGQSTVDGVMTVLNFSNVPTDELGALIDSKLGGEYEVTGHKVHAAFPSKEEYQNGLSQSNTGRDEGALWKAADLLRSEATRLIEQELRQAPSHSLKQGSDAAGSGRAGSMAGQEVRPGSVDVVGTHFSTQQRTRLDGRHYGRGLKGAERARLEQSTDPRIKERVYMYVDEGAGVRPESGVGAYAHRIDGKNLYDMGRDPQRLGRADGNAMESAVLDAGFDGYYVPKVFNNQGVAVIMGKASHNVAATPLQTGATSAGANASQAGQDGRGATQSRKEGSTYVLKPKGGSEELQLIKARKAIEAAAPSYKLQYGEHRVAEADRDAANQALAGAGSELRFSPKAAIEDGRLNFSPKLEQFAKLAFEHGKRETQAGVELSVRSPHPAFTMMGGGRDQPLKLHANYAWHIHNNHPDITAKDIAELPELLKKPRAIINYGNGQISVIVGRRDADGNPMLVGFEKVTVRGRSEQRINDLHTMFGWQDSLKRIFDAAQMKTASVWMPSEEVSRVQGITAGDHPRQAADQATSSQLVSPVTSGAAAPRGRKLPATKISVLSDEALDKFASASKQLHQLPKTEITIPAGADLSGVNFSRKFTSEVPEETKTEGFRRQAQDQHIRMRTLREWATANGITMSAASDVYTTEERMHGRQASRIEDFREKRVKPLVEKLQKSGHNLAQVEEYLQAQHAEERNRAVAKINKTMPDGGSGMLTADARAILQAAPASLKAIANEFQAITTDSRNTLLRSGIISQDMADAWDKAYKHYVPLKGGDDEDAGKTGQGKGLSVNGKQKRAMGHGERDEHIVENILRDHERAIMLAEKNRVGQAMLLWLTEMNDPRIGTVDKPVKRAVLMPSYQYDVRLMGLSVQTFDTEGQARNFIMQQIQANSPGAKQLKISKTVADQNVQYMASPMLQPNEAQVYVNGSAVRLQLNDELLARSYKRLGSDQMSRFIASARAVNTYLSKAYTGYNPAFIPRNLIRDFGSGLVKITGNFGAGITTSTLANYPAAMGSLLKYSITGKSTPLIDEYRAHGGSTGAAYLGDLDRIGRNIRDDFERYQGVMAQLRNPAKTGRERAASAARVASQKVIGGLIGWIEHLNMATENAMRVAVFKAVKDSGASIEEAASAAKNSTVNFNRKGELGQTMGALYLFYNPNVQDTASVIETFTRGKHRGQAVALVSAMIGLSYALAAMQFGGDDDDYKAWKEIPDNVRDKNLVLRTGVDDKGKQTYVKIPVPFGFGFFHTLANSLFMAQKGESIDRLSVGVASNLASHFSPMGNPLEGVTSWRKVSPVQVAATAMPGFGAGELGRDALKLVVNKNSFGSEIYPESPFDSEKPDFLKLYRGTKGSVWDTLATGMSKATGGTATQAGMVDVSPETLKFWNSAITGGTGTFLYDIAHVTDLNARYYANPDDPHREALNTERGERPILRDYLGEVTVKDARRAFWDAAKDADSVVENFKRAQKGRDVEAMKAIRQDNKEALQLAEVADGFKKLVKAKRDRVDQINADTTTSLAFKRAAMAEVEKAEQASYDKFVGIVIGKEHKRAERLAGSN